MPGAFPPAVGDLSVANDPSEADAAVDLEAITEILRRMAGVGLSITPTYSIVAGVLTAGAGSFFIDTEGAVAEDFLDTIEIDTYAAGSLIWVQAADPGRTVKLRHAQGGNGQLSLAGATDFDLDDSQKVVVFALDGTTWEERTRFYGSDVAGFRAFLGLGTAALLNDGAVDAATLGGVAAAGYLLASAQAADSALLAGLAPAAFARVTIAALQLFAGAIQTNGNMLTINAPTPAISSFLDLASQGTTRTRLSHDPVSKRLELELFDTNGTTVLNAIRFAEATVPEYFDSGGGGWTPLLVPTDVPSIGDRLVRWDKLDAVAGFVGIASHVLHTTAAPLLPSSGATARYRVSAGVGVARGASNSPTGRLRVMFGPAGDETDTEVLSTSFGPVVSGVEDIDIAEIEIELPVSSGDKVSLVLDVDNLAQADVHPSTVNGFATDNLTYLHVQQIG